MITRTTSTESIASNDNLILDNTCGPVALARHLGIHVTDLKSQHLISNNGISSGQLQTLANDNGLCLNHANLADFSKGDKGLIVIQARNPGDRGHIVNVVNIDGVLHVEDVRAHPGTRILEEGRGRIYERSGTRQFRYPLFEYMQKFQLSWDRMQFVKVQSTGFGPMEIDHSGTFGSMNGKSYATPKSDPVKDGLQKNVKNNLKPKPNASFGMSSMADMIDNYDRAGTSYAGTLETSAGTYTTRTRTGVHASASTAQTGASWSVFSASANAPTVSAGASIGVDGAKAFASADVASARANAGPVNVRVGLDLSTGAGIGPDGIQANVAGFGFNLGPRFTIKTPIVDIGCNLF